MSAYSALKLKERRTPCNGSIIANLIPLANLAMNEQGYMDMTGKFQRAKHRAPESQAQLEQRFAAQVTVQANGHKSTLQKSLEQIRDTLEQTLKQMIRDIPILFGLVDKQDETLQQFVTEAIDLLGELEAGRPKQENLDDILKRTIQFQHALEANHGGLADELRNKLIHEQNVLRAIKATKTTVLNKSDSTRTLFENPIFHMEQESRTKCLDVLSYIGFGKGVDDAIATAKDIKNKETLEQDLARVYNKANEYLDEYRDKHFDKHHDKKRDVNLTVQQAGVLAALGLNRDKAAKRTAFKIKDTIDFAFCKANNNTARRHILQLEVPIMDLLMGLASNRVIDHVASLENLTDEELDVAAAAFTLLNQVVIPINENVITPSEKDRCDSLVCHYVIEKKLEFVGSSLELVPCCKLIKSLQEPIPESLNARHIRLHRALGDLDGP